MKQRPEIHIDVDLDGGVTIDVVCAVGAGCEKLTENISRALGERISDEKKPEYFRKEEAHATAKR